MEGIKRCRQCVFCITFVALRAQSAEETLDHLQSSTEQVRAGVVVPGRCCARERGKRVAECSIEMAARLHT